MPTTDLTTCRTYPSNPADLLTKQTGCHPADRPTPKWDAFLASTFQGDEELIAYMQRLVGYSLTGLQDYHVLPFLHGSGQNGKSVFLDVLLAIAGDYGTTAPANFLMAGGSGHPTEIARLRGVRLVVCNEVGPDDKFDEVKVKMLTGGDRLTGRYMRKDFFTFQPSHHIWLAGNHQPRIGAGGDSFWRRLRLIPFTHRVPDNEVIPGLAATLFKEEGPGILHWAMLGAKEVIQGGSLRDPEKVLAATRQYAEEEDVLGRFFEERCYFSKGARIDSRLARRAYTDWCHDNGERPLTPQQLVRELRARHRVEVQKSHGKSFYAGMDLQPEDDLSGREINSWIR